MVLGDTVDPMENTFSKTTMFFWAPEDVARAHEDAELGERWPVEAQPRGLMFPSVGVGYQE